MKKRGPLPHQRLDHDLVPALRRTVLAADKDVQGTAARLRAARAAAGLAAPARAQVGARAAAQGYATGSVRSTWRLPVAGGSTTLQLASGEGAAAPRRRPLWGRELPGARAVARWLRR